ncbi:MAG: hypothetical protein M3463_03215 [Verrucomicrobiota bacterium]|nr:hypothetical protein [Verrucomicrobiota bacterium]
MQELDARRIAVPPFDVAALERGHAVHFRCLAAGVEDLRVDVMIQLRDLPPFAVLWERRTSFTDDTSMVFDLLSIPDLVQAKKTQRSKDWPVIELLVNIHHRENANAPRPDWIKFWLWECRSTELLVELARAFPAEADTLTTPRPLLATAKAGDLDALAAALDAETRAEMAKDRIYWAPLKRELEAMRRAESRTERP